MDADGTLYEKGSRWSGAPASLVKRSVIKISRQRGREEHGSIDADSGPSGFYFFLPPLSIDLFSQLQPARGEEEEEE